MKNIIIATLLLLSLSACSERISDYQLKECSDVSLPLEASVNDLQGYSARCQAAANIDLIERTQEYDRWSLKHRSNILYMQNIYTVIGLLMVVIVLCFGLLVSFSEFKNKESSEHNIKLGTSGIEISSKFLGVIVLVISLGFAYLFFEKAYPISEIKSENQTSSSIKK